MWFFSSFGDRVYSLWLVIFCVSIGCFCVFSILCASIGYLFRTCVLGADHGSSRVILLSSRLNPITVCTPISKMASSEPSVYPTDPPRLVTPSTMPARWKQKWRSLLSLSSLSLSLSLLSPLCYSDVTNTSDSSNTNNKCIQLTPAILRPTHKFHTNKGKRCHVVLLYYNPQCACVSTSFLSLSRIICVTVHHK